MISSFMFKSAARSALLIPIGTQDLVARNRLSRAKKQQRNFREALYGPER
jgi:hypothetical protein